MGVLINDYQVKLEELAAVKKLIEAPWDPNQHIITMFNNVKTHLTTLAEMENTIPYLEEDFIEVVYMAVQGEKQFIKVCEK